MEEPLAAITQPRRTKGFLSCSHLQSPLPGQGAGYEPTVPRTLLGSVVPAERAESLDPEPLLFEQLPKDGLELGAGPLRWTSTWSLMTNQALRGGGCSKGSRSR
jgi:hypothetical protein